MKLFIQDLDGKQTGECDLAVDLPGPRKGTQAVHDAVVAHRANQRMGTACTKTAGEVAGTNKKPWRQKGTGRARAGSFQSPLWRGGGVVFGPKPRSYSKKVNVKTKRLALRRALGERARSNDLIIVESLSLVSAKTKEFAALLERLRVRGMTVLLCVQGEAGQLRLAARNYPGVELTTGEQLNTYQILRYDKVVLDRPALEAVQSRLK